MIVASFRKVNSLSRIAVMRSTLRLFLVLVALVSIGLLVSPALDLPAASVASAQTQMQLNQEACDEYKKADAEMNTVYRRITTDYRKDASFIRALKKAQLAWLRFRDAHLESVFPGAASQYGSISPMCRCMTLAEITKARTQTLNRWVEGIEEGDVCAGSVKVK